MTIVFECSPPFQVRPGLHKSRLSYRVWWLWFAVSWLRIPYKQWVETPKVWEYK